jgi:hypothetical protein
MHTVQAPPSSPGHGAAPISCPACTRTFSKAAFEALPFKGTEHLGGELHEIRRCACGRHVRTSRGPAGPGLLS